MKHAPTHQRKKLRALRALEVRWNRYAMGLTMAQLADKLGVSERTVEAWEYGQNTPSPATLQALTRLRNEAKPRLP